MRYRRVMMLPASAGGNRVPVIAQPVQADEDTVRDVIHRFNGIGLACLDPQWVGRRPRLLTPDDEDFVIQTATPRPTTLVRPFTRWSIRELAACPRRVHGRVIRIGREALRCLLARRGTTFQRTKTWKDSPDPDRDAKLHRIEQVLGRLPDRVFAFDAAPGCRAARPGRSAPGMRGFHGSDARVGNGGADMRGGGGPAPRRAVRSFPPRTDALVVAALTPVRGPGRDDVALGPDRGLLRAVAGTRPGRIRRGSSVFAPNALRWEIARGSCMQQK
ncbi:hypothetical protein GCM10010398_61450 [Streptomyces fimbriatus]